MINRTPLGIIEGFFGRSWSWAQRAELAGFLREQSYQYYIYAPKSDKCLRSAWQTHWAPSQWQALTTLRQHYHSVGIKFGIGLSPLDLCNPQTNSHPADLTRKIEQLNRLEPDIVALLFDDMRGDIPQLAHTQVELAHRVAEQSSASHIILCPTYYSDDPILPTVFGERPHNYWQTLGRQLDPAIDLFWTGPKVCTEQFSREHLTDVSERLERRPWLWDNYPVNDGAVKSKHLYLKPFSHDRANIGDLLAGHAVNPMNQFNLSKLALASLPYAYQKAVYEPEVLFKQILEQQCPQALRAALTEDAHRFAASGLEAISPAERVTLAQQYHQLDHNSGMGHEVADWLNGLYSFDPACLTD